MPMAETTRSHLRIWRQGWVVAAMTSSVGEAPGLGLDQGAVLLGDHQLVAQPGREVLHEEQGDDEDHQ